MKTGVDTYGSGIDLYGYMCGYDVQGRLLFKDSPNGGDYLWDGWRMVKKQAWPWGGFGETVEYVWGKDLSGTAEGAGGVGGLLAVRVDGAWHFPLYDHNGNITAYVSESGAVSAEYEYDPFGKVIAHTGRDFDFQFSTKFHDPDIDMYYYGYRYYSPELRRWASPDPIGEAGGLNLYGFCGNVPISFIDTNGMFTFADFKGKPDSDSFFSAMTVYEFNYDNNPGEIIYEVVEHSGESCKTALKFGMINGEQGYYQDPQCPCEKCYTSRASYSKYTFSVTFISEKSWVRHPNIDGLLRHENMHLFIAQKTAKEESEKLTAIWGESNVKYCDKDRSKHYAQEALLTRIAEKYKEIQKNDELVQIAFDAETEHGMNREEEEKWEKKLGYR